MKRIIFFIFLVFTSMVLFASEEYSVAFGMRTSSQTTDHHYFVMEGEKNNFTFTVMENGGEYISLDTTYNSDFSPFFHWNAGTAFNYFSTGATSLMVKGNIDVDYGTDSVFLNFGVGVQVAALKYSQLNTLLFSLSPLANLSLNLKAGCNSFSFGMMMDMKYERQFKAVETFFLQMRKDLSSSFALSLEVWGRGAEYLMDPWLSFQSYGGVVKFSLKNEDNLH